MIAGVRAVNASHADLGIVVDTDVDRSAVVAGNGTPINSNRYIALMAYIALRWAGVFMHKTLHHPGHLAHSPLYVQSSTPHQQHSNVNSWHNCFEVWGDSFIQPAVNGTDKHMKVRSLLACSLRCLGSMSACIHLRCMPNLHCCFTCRTYSSPRVHYAFLEALSW